MKVGVIGVGVVGGAVLEGFRSKGIEVKGYDIAKPYLNTYEEVMRTDAAFVCVPTSTKSDGTQDLKPLSDALMKADEWKYRGVLAIKSTILPGTTNMFQESYPGLKIVHQPEFLTERNAIADFRDQKHVFIGGQRWRQVSLAYGEIGLTNIHVYEDASYTEMIKYTNNLFLALQVSFLNEMNSVCESLGIEYEKMIGGARELDKLAESHLKVPGPDGKPGFGGMCFVKDTTAFVHRYPQMKTISAAIGTNRVIRPQAYDGTEKVGVIR